MEESQESESQESESQEAREAPGEEEPEDAVPEGWKEDSIPWVFPASRQLPTPLTPIRTPIQKAAEAFAYLVAGGWPFLAAWIEFLRLDSAHTLDTNSCSYEGCSLESHIFLQQAMDRVLLASCASLVLTAGLIRLRRFMLTRRLTKPASEAPVNRFVLAGIFFGICTLAFLFGILRGVIISHYGH